VQYRRDGAWVDLDPSAGVDGAGQSVTPASSTATQPPPASNWFVTIKVVVERWSDGRLSEQVALRHRVAATDVAWQDVTLVHSPVGFDPKAQDRADAAQVRAAALAVREWVPVLLVGKQQIAQKRVSDDGSVHERTPGQPGNLSAVGGLFGALGGDETATDAGGVLTAEWVDFEIEGPETPRRVARRESFDLLGPHARRAGAREAPRADEDARARRALALLGRTAIHVQVCMPSPAFLAHRMLSAFTGSRDALLAMAGQGAAPGVPPARVLHGLSPLGMVLWGHALKRFDGSAVGDRVFIGSPNIAALRWDVLAGSGPTLTERAVFDIVANDVEVVGEGTRHPFATRVEQGVADTAAEARAYQGRNTVGLFQAAAEASIPTEVLRSKAPGPWRREGVAPDVVARIAADVGTDHHVALPSRSVTLDGAPTLGWWKVAASTGTTVGVMETGFHQATAEWEAAAAGALGAILANEAWETGAAWYRVYKQHGLSGMLAIFGSLVLKAAEEVAKLEGRGAPGR
jgi:hypothetical protein